MFTNLLSKKLSPMLRGVGRKRLLLFASLLIPLLTSAYDFEVDGIFYQKSDEGRVYVCSNNSNETSYRGNIIIPSTISVETGDMYAVVGIANYAFKNCSELISINLPDSLINIGAYSFQGCTGLSSVTIPEGVKTIGDNAFKDCSGLKEIYFNPSNCTSVTSYGYTVVPFPPNVETIVIGDNVTNIPSYTFSGCSNLNTLTIGISVSKIGNYAFQGCESLQVLTIPENVTSIGNGAFKDCTGLATVNFNATNCNSCGSSYNPAFPSNLTTVVIGDQVTELPDYCFYGCESLTSLTFGNSLSAIGMSAFQECKGLSSLTLQVSVTSIKSSTFRNCTGLTNITLHDALTSIGAYSFQGCTGLSTVTIPKGVTTIGVNAFKDCTGLKEVYFNPTNCTAGTSYGYSVGPFPHNVETIVIGDNVTNIPSYTFKDCSNLNTLTIGTSVSKIGTYAFQGCESLQVLTIPENVSSIGSSAFKDCTGLATVNFNAHNCNSCGSSSNPAFPTNITTVVIGDQVTELPDYCFYGCESLTSLTFGNSLSAIGMSAFQECKGLSSVTLPVSVTSIKSSTFRNCTGLTNITLQDALTSIEAYSFQGCTGLSTVTIPKGVTTIGVNAFKDCTGLKEVYFNPTNCTTGTSYGYSVGPFPHNVETIVIGDNVTNIPSYTFKDCSNLNTLTIGTSVSEIGTYAFQGCESLQVLTIPENVSSIGSSAFKDCTGLATVNFNAHNCNSCGSSYNPAFPTNITTVVIGDQVTELPDYCFYGCESLTSLTFGNSLSAIGVSAFQGCKGLTSLTLPVSVTSIKSSTFRNCTGLTDIALHDALTSIGAYSFQGCTGLSSVTIPEGVKTIGNNAFKECSGLREVYFNPTNCTSANADGTWSSPFPPNVESIIIGDNVTNIPGYTFKGCNQISYLFIPGQVANISNDVFSGCEKLTLIECIAPNPPKCNTNTFNNFAQENCLLRVPEEVISAYKAAYYWRDFPNIQGMTLAELSDEEWELVKELKDNLVERGWAGTWNTDGNRSAANYFRGLELGDDRVTGISLPSAKISGTFPLTALKFEKLANLNLSGNQIEDSAEAIGSFLKDNPELGIELATINLSNNKLTGNLSDLASRCPALTELNVDGNAFRDVNPPLSKTITKLDISKQEIPDTLTLNLGNPFDFILNLPTILTYNHKTGAYDNLNFTVEAPATEDVAGTLHDAWKVKLALADGNLSFTKTGNQSNYYGKSGDVVTLTNSANSTANTSFIFRQGDTNFDGALDVADLQATIKMIFAEYLSRPYNFTAGDIVADALLNVQDVVGEVTLLMNETHSDEPTPAEGPARLREDFDAAVYCGNEGLILDSRRPVAAFDIVLGENNYDLSRLNDLPGFICDSRTDNGRTHIIGYSLSGETLPAGRTVLLPAAEGNAAVCYAAACDDSADKLRTAYGRLTTGLFAPADGKLSVSVKDGCIMIEGAEGPLSWTVATLDGRILSDGHADVSALSATPIAMDFDGVVIISIRTANHSITKKINLNQSR